jgi:hypothetical protein
MFSASLRNEKTTDTNSTLTLLGAIDTVDLIRPAGGFEGN